ncbi:MAG: DUF2306 domain-containing protein [Roseovarius sp.]|nr:DUF2306 domain-containing protein [Roseovarius sp.]MCY4292153.1 DUF2306 domain-containing protein [Roseovarius sp.]MCY4316745.1 DUF2306 domain-containing protein [Roseovarius sp.]
MDFSHLMSAQYPIPIHAILALAALGLGIVQITSRKGTALHRFAGYIWVVFMAGTAITAIFIFEIRVVGPFSPIHLLIPVVLASLWVGIRSARNGNIATHRLTMLSLFWMALVVTGFFTLLPGRVMYNVIFGG